MSAPSITIASLRLVARTLACTALLCGASGTVSAATAPAAAEAPAAARVNGEAIHAFTYQAMLHASQDSKPRPTPAAVLDELVAERLLAAWARSRFSADQLYPQATVGFARAAALDDRLVGLVRSMYARELEAALRALPGGDIKGLVVETRRPDAAMLERLFGQPGRMRLDYRLGAEQEAHAARVPLLRYTLAGQPGTLTVLDVLRRQNVQGRMAFFNRQVDFMEQEARLALASLFVQDWAARRFGAQTLADLRRALADQDDVRAARSLYGLAGHAESESPLQAALARQVTPGEIAAYYRAHKDQFRRVERVKARHIRLADEAAAARVAAAARAGQDFAQLARRHSMAPDAPRGGDLGWVRRSADPGWLASLVLLQPVGKVSSPIRAAVDGDEDASWEVLLVEQRIEGHYPLDSETVRYLARQAVAHDKARREFAAVRAQLLRRAAIEIDPRLRGRKLPQAPQPAAARRAP